MTLHSRIAAYLDAHNTMTLATTGPDGRPHACAVFYAAAPDLSLVFLSEPKTLHGQHIGEEAPVAATVEANNQDWTAIQGLQVHGIARLCRDDAEARSLYTARFPFVGRAQTLAGPLSRARFYRLTPHWMRLTDNTLGFGHKEEWHFER